MYEERHGSLDTIFQWQDIFYGNILIAASERGVQEAMLILARRGVNPDVEDMFGYTPMFYAVFREYEEVVHYLMSRVNINYVGRWLGPSETYLDLAIRQMGPEVVKTLMMSSYLQDECSRKVKNIWVRIHKSFQYGDLEGVNDGFTVDISKETILSKFST